MRRAFVPALLAVSVLFGNGCVAVVGNRGHFRGCPTTSAVAIDGQVYLVDHCTRRVQKLDPAAVSNAEVVTQIEVEEVDKTDED